MDFFRKLVSNTGSASSSRLRPNRSGLSTPCRRLPPLPPPRFALDSPPSYHDRTHLPPFLTVIARAWAIAEGAVNCEWDPKHQSVHHRPRHLHPHTSEPDYYFVSTVSFSETCQFPFHYLLHPPAVLHPHPTRPHHNSPAIDGIGLAIQTYSCSQNCSVALQRDLSIASRHFAVLIAAALRGDGSGLKRFGFAFRRNCFLCFCLLLISSSHIIFSQPFATATASAVISSFASAWSTQLPPGPSPCLPHRHRTQPNLQFPLPTSSTARILSLNSLSLNPCRCSPMNPPPRQAAGLPLYSWRVSMVHWEIFTLWACSWSPFSPAHRTSTPLGRLLHLPPLPRAASRVIWLTPEEWYPSLLLLELSLD